MLLDVRKRMCVGFMRVESTLPVVCHPGQGQPHRLQAAFYGGKLAQDPPLSPADQQQPSIIIRREHLQCACSPGRRYNMENEEKIVRERENAQAREKKA
jgi:hypothetical protein